LCFSAAHSGEQAKSGGGWGEETFCLRAGASPVAPPEYLEGGTEQKFPFPFLNFFQGARKRKIVRENFCEVAAGAIAEADGGAESVRFSFASPRAPRVAHCQRF